MHIIAWHYYERQGQLTARSTTMGDGNHILLPRHPSANGGRIEGGQKGGCVTLAGGRSVPSVALRSFRGTVSLSIKECTSEMFPVFSAWCHTRKSCSRTILTVYNTNNTRADTSICYGQRIWMRTVSLTTGTTSQGRFYLYEGYGPSSYPCQWILREKLSPSPNQIIEES
jgi:hypothetical protein